MKTPERRQASSGVARRDYASFPHASFSSINPPPSTKKECVSQTRDRRIDQLIGRQLKQLASRPSSTGWRRIAQLKKRHSAEHIAALEAKKGLL